MANIGPSSLASRQHPRVWLLSPYRDQYWREKYSSPKDYYAGLREEWVVRVEEQKRLVTDLQNFRVRIPKRRSQTMPRRNMEEYEEAVQRIKRESNRMLMRRCRYYMLQLATEMAEASHRELTTEERTNALNNEKYLSDFEMSNED